MTLAGQLRALLSPHRVGERLAPGVVWKAVSVELGLGLTCEVDGVEVHVEVTPAGEHPALHAARSRRLLFAYRNDGAPLPGDVGARLCARIAEIAEANEDAVLAAIEAEARQARDLEGSAGRMRQVVVDELLTPGGKGTDRYDTLSPYVGCSIGCRFCYAQERLLEVRRLALLPDTPWGSYVDVRVNAAEILARELVSREPLPIKFCPIVSDPYQAIEAKVELTRRCLEVIRDVAPERTVLLLTRSRLVLRDLDILKQLPFSYVGMSLPTIDDEVRLHFEPRSASVAERIEVLRRFRDAGVRTFAMVQPLLPGSVEGLADALEESVDSVRIDVLHGVYGAARDFDAAPHRHAASPRWQADTARSLRSLLEARGVPMWSGELPPSTAA